MRTQQLARLTFLSLCLLPVLATAQQQKQQQPQSETAKILALEAKWTEAYKLRQIDILSTLLAKNFVITVEDGSTYGKSGYITHSADTSVHVDLAEQSGLKVRMYGNTAVVTGAYHEKGSSKGKPYGSCRIFPFVTACNDCSGWLSPSMAWKRSSVRSRPGPPNPYINQYQATGTIRVWLSTKLADYPFG